MIKIFYPRSGARSRSHGASAAGGGVHPSVEAGVRGDGEDDMAEGQLLQGEHPQCGHSPLRHRHQAGQVPQV